MRKINYIVIHHSATNKELDTEKSLKSFNNSHYERLHKVFLQEKWWWRYPHIAYHYCIDKTWKVIPTRSENSVWFHASDLKINKEWIWICLIWDFDTEHPEIEQIKSLQRTISQIESRLWKVKTVFHSDITNKTCPWKNISKDLIKAWEYELLFKLWEDMWKSLVLRDIEGWITKNKIERELAFSLLIMFNRIKK